MHVWKRGITGGQLREGNYRTPYAESAIKVTYFLVIAGASLAVIGYFVYLVLTRGYTSYPIEHPTWADVVNNTGNVISCTCTTDNILYTNALIKDQSCADGSELSKNLVIRTSAMSSFLRSYWANTLSRLQTDPEHWSPLFFDTSSSLSRYEQATKVHQFMWALLVCSWEYSPYMQTFYSDMSLLYTCGCNTSLCTNALRNNIWPNTTENSALNCTVAKSNLTSDYLQVLENYMTHLAANTTEKLSGVGMSVGIAAAITASLHAVATLAGTVRTRIIWEDISVDAWANFHDYNERVLRAFLSFNGDTIIDERVFSAVSAHYHLNPGEETIISYLTLNAELMANAITFYIGEGIYNSIAETDMNETFFDWCVADQCLETQRTKIQEVVLTALGTISLIFAVGWVVGRQVLRILSTKSCCLLPNPVDWKEYDLPKGVPWPASKGKQQLSIDSSNTLQEMFVSANSATHQPNSSHPPTPPSSPRKRDNT